MPTAKYYYECHITIEPVFDSRLEQAIALAKANKFLVADLLMKKREEDSEERSKNDTFMTGRHKDFVTLETRMISLIRVLKDAGFRVWRYKIEDTLEDSKHNDYLGLLQ